MRSAIGAGLLAGLLTAGAVLADPSPPAAVGLTPDMRFDEPTKLAEPREMARRLLSPFAAAALPDVSQTIGDAALSLADERFVLYVPPDRPPEGYALLVFVPPWQGATLPQGWASALDRLGVIYVSAARSGNKENSLTRREPLALIAAANVMRRYPVDPRHVLVAGFSGGARVALRLALGYPDLFTGALLNAGSDPIGTADLALPPAPLFARFQAESQLVTVTGDEDSANIALDGESWRSWRDWCQFAVRSETMPWRGHALIDAFWLSHALRALLMPWPRDAAQLADCRAAVDERLSAAFGGIDRLLAQGESEKARAALLAVDQEYGGLAAPQTIDYMMKLRP